MTQIRDTRTHRTYIIALAFVTGLSLLLPAYSAAADIQADFGLLNDDNVTRTFDGGGKLSDQSISVNFSLPASIPVSTNTRAIVTGSLGAEIFSEYGELSNVSGSIQGVYQYRNSAEFGTPVWGLFANLGMIDYQSTQRDGLVYAAGVSVQKSITDKIRMFGAISHNERDGSHDVFKNKHDAVLINLDYEVRSLGTIYLGGEYRQGYIVISAPFWTWYTTSYPSRIALDDAFPNSTYSYLVDGDTQIFKLGFNLAIGQESSMDFSFNQIDSTATYWTSTFQTASLSYSTNLYSVAYLTKF